nr:hypothetical protein [Streptomyces agglomeratus]
MRDSKVPDGARVAVSQPGVGGVCPCCAGWGVRGGLASRAAAGKPSGLAPG